MPACTLAAINASSSLVRLTLRVGIGAPQIHSRRDGQLCQTVMAPSKAGWESGRGQRLIGCSCARKPLILTPLEARPAPRPGDPLWKECDAGAVGCEAARCRPLERRLWPR